MLDNNDPAQPYRNAIAELTMKLLDAETNLRACSNEIKKLRTENTALNKELAQRDLENAEAVNAATAE